MFFGDALRIDRQYDRAVCAVSLCGRSAVVIIMVHSVPECAVAF